MGKIESFQQLDAWQEAQSPKGTAGPEWDRR